MGWMISIALFVAWFFNPDMSVLLVASGLFAIAGSISFKDFKKTGPFMRGRALNKGSSF